MTIDEKMIAAVKEMIDIYGIGHLVTTAELHAFVGERYKIVSGSIIPSDYCYNRVNDGIALTKPTLFEYVERGTYRCLGEGYPYNGGIYHKGRRVGNCVNGKRQVIDITGVTKLEVCAVPISDDLPPVDKLVQACERLFELDSLALSDAYYYSSLPLCVIDAVFSIGVKYTSTENTVRRYCEYFQVKKYDRNRTSTKMQHSISEFIANIEKIGIARSADIVFKNHQRTSAKNGILKAEAVLLFAKILQKYGIETFKDLHAKGLSEEAESELRQIPGQRSGLSLQYFYMLSGDDTLAKPDRHILRFIHQHTGKVPTMREAQELMTQTVAKLKNRYLNLNVRLLDYTIWDYMAHSAGKGK